MGNIRLDCGDGYIATCVFRTIHKRSIKRMNFTVCKLYLNKEMELKITYDYLTF